MLLETKSSRENQKLIFKIRNILRSLGLNTSIQGTVLINKAIRIILENEKADEYIKGNDIYRQVAEYYKNISFMQVKTYIQYALDHRNIKLAQKNFEKIFGFEYDSYYYTNKRFLEELSQILLLKDVK